MFALDLTTPAPGQAPEPAPPGPAPWYAIAVLAATLARFGLSGLAGVHPVWIAATGALALAVPRLRHPPLATAMSVVVAKLLWLLALV